MRLPARRPIRFAGGGGVLSLAQWKDRGETVNDQSEAQSARLKTKDVEISSISHISLFL